MLNLKLVYSNNYEMEFFFSKIFASKLVDNDLILFHRRDKTLSASEKRMACIINALKVFMLVVLECSLFNSNLIRCMRFENVSVCAPAVCHSCKVYSGLPALSWH